MIVLPSKEIPEKFTGERYVPSVSGEIEWLHLHRYALALDFCAQKVVLDIASGEGYGSDMLAQVAESVVGVDIDVAAVDTASKRYRRANLTFKLGCCEAIPLETHSIDIVVSFETIEHVVEPEKFLKEVFRVLRPDGILIISSPEKGAYNAQRDGSNPFHCSEMSSDEFRTQLAKKFQQVEFARQGSLFASIAMPMNHEQNSSTQMFRSEAGLLQSDSQFDRAEYLVALCSNRPAPIAFTPSIFDGGLSPTILSALKAGIVERDQKILKLVKKYESKELQVDARKPQSGQLNSDLESNQEAVKMLEIKIQEMQQQLLETKKRERNQQRSFLAFETELKELRQEIHGSESMLVQLRQTVERESSANQSGAEIYFGSALPVKLNNKTSVGWPGLCRIKKLMRRALSKTTKLLKPASEFCREITVIRESGLFDVAYYLKHNPDVANDAVDPLRHYLERGWKEGRNPNPLFDSQWYLKRYGDVANSGMNPLFHYVLDGAIEKRQPGPYFDVGYYLDRYQDLSETSNPLAHFIQHGSREDRIPVKSFDLQFFYEWCPEALSAPNGAYLFYLDNFIQGTQSLLTSEELAKRAEELRWQINGASNLCDSSSSLQPEVSIIIPVFNQLRFTLRSLCAVLKSNPKSSFEILIVDDCSTDQTSHVLENLPGLRLIKQAKNAGFISSSNLGAEQARGKYLVFLNNDTNVFPGWLDELHQTLERDSSIGLVGSQLIYPDGILQEAGSMICRNGSAWNRGNGADRNHPVFNYARDVDYCSGASIMISADLFKEVGMFDSHFAPAYYEDPDLAFKVQAKGLRVVYQPLSRVVHFEGLSMGRDLTKGLKAYQKANEKKFFARWKDSLKNHAVGIDRFSLTCNRKARGRILFLDACTPMPDRDAGSIAASTWIDIFLSLNYDVTFIPQDNLLRVPPYTERLQRKGVQCLYGPFVSSLDEYIKEWGSSFDLVVAFRYRVALVAFSTLHRYAPRVKTIFNPVDLHYLREGRQAELEQSEQMKLQAMKTKYEELLVISQSDLVSVFSFFEKEEILRQLPSTDVRVLPIVLEETPGRSTDFSSRKDICFIGGYQHLPNVDAVMFFVHEVLPLIHKEIPELKFKIVGSAMKPEVAALASDQVEVVGFVKDLAPLLNSVRLSVAPLRYGAGVKGKVSTSMSFAVPVVGTDIAFEGMDLVDGLEVLTANSSAEIAQQIVRVYQDEQLWQHISDNAFARVEREYSLKANQRALQDYISDVLQ